MEPQNETTPTPTPTPNPAPQAQPTPMNMPKEPVVTPGETPQPTETEAAPSHKNVWLSVLLGVILVLVVLGLGGFYLWGAYLAKEQAPEVSEEEAMEESEDAQMSNDPTPENASVNTNSIESIEEDLEEDFSDIDAAFEEMDAEFDAAAEAEASS